MNFSLTTCDHVPTKQDHQKKKNCQHLRNNVIPALDRLCLLSSHVGLVYYVVWMLDSFQELCSGIGTDNDQNGAGILYLYSPASTTYMKNWCCRSNVYELGDYTQEYYMSGFFNTTSAINALRFQMHTGNIDDGTIKMYGIA